MQSKQKTVYYCEYCGKYLLIRLAMDRHERQCHQNPANRHACWDCRHLTVQTVERYVHDEDGLAIEPDYEIKVFSCDKYHREMYSYKAEVLGLLSKYPREFQSKTRMPDQCEGKQRG